MLLSSKMLDIYSYAFVVSAIIHSMFCTELLENFGSIVMVDVSKAVQRVGKFLIQHKFFERDQRLTRAELMQQDPYFMTKFPEPPLERLPTIVMGECRRGFIPCLKRVDKLIGVNFTRKDLFMIRTAASYYMCWFTMLLEPMLAKFHRTCHIPYVIPDLAEDYRGFDSQVFDCAYHSFCPDPCCGLLNRTSTRSRDYKKNLNRPYVRGTSRYKSECNSLPDYPCGFAAGGCRYDAKRNRNFRDLIANKFNLTCSCIQYRNGFVFDGHFGMCVDYDECRHKNYMCETQSVCRNLESDYYCTCSLGYKFNYSLQKCIKDENFELSEILAGDEKVDIQARRISNPKEFFLITWTRWLISLVTSLINT